VGFGSNLGAEGLVQPNPFYIKATVSGGVSLWAKACGVGTSLDTSVKFSGGAPPLSLCGGINVYVDLWPDDIDFTIHRCLF
jgi:hypothetical protein